LIDDDYGIFLNCFCLLPISKGNFVMLWNLSFKNKDMKKINLTDIMFDARPHIKKPLFNLFLLVTTKV
jgi:hypothetical protein